jgi:hypothetical protein
MDGTRLPPQDLKRSAGRASPSPLQLPALTWQQPPRSMEIPAAMGHVDYRIPSAQPYILLYNIS